MRMGAYLRLNLLTLALVLGVSSCQKTYVTGYVDPARFHADALVAGDFRTALDPKVPYHLDRLLELGPLKSGGVLHELLANTSPTPIQFIGDNIRWAAISSINEPVERRAATIGDLADWAMRQLYRVPLGVGYRGDLPAPQRKEAIHRWLKVIEAFFHEELRRQQARPERDTALPGRLFPGVD